MVKPVPAVLGEVTISGRTVSIPWRFEEVYRRAATGFGHFITAEQIQQLNPSGTRELLNGIPGIVVNNYEVVFPRCGRGPLNGPQLRMAAVPQVYIDSRRVTAFGGSVDAALALVNPRSIQAIEIYTGVSQIPADFMTEACAVVAIWTKKY